MQTKRPHGTNLISTFLIDFLFSFVLKSTFIEVYLAHTFGIVTFQIQMSIFLTYKFFKAKQKMETIKYN